MGAVDKTGWVLGTVLAKQGAALRDIPFVQFQDDPPYTFGDMDARANRVANALAALGVQRGERVLLMLPNSVAFLDAWFGINRLGAGMPGAGSQQPPISLLFPQHGAIIRVADRLQSGRSQPLQLPSEQGS